MVNKIDVAKQADRLAAGSDTITNNSRGFYPKAREFGRNIWIDMDRCFSCGHRFEMPSELEVTYCKQCNRTFVG